MPTAKKPIQQNIQFQSLLQSTPIAVVLLNEKALVQFANEKLTEILGEDPEVWLGRSAFEMISPEFRPAVKREWLRSQKSGVKFQFEFSVLHKDHNFRWALARCQPMQEGSGKITGYVLTLEDLTQYKLVQEDLRKAKEEAIQGLVAKSSFLANMSHEIRTPLNAIIGLADLLSDTPLNPEQRSYVNTFVKAGNNLLSIINDILDLSKFDQVGINIKKDKFSLNQIFTELSDLFKFTVKEKNISLEFVKDEMLPDLIYSDISRMRQIFVNLIGNAFKFTQQGSIQVRARFVPSGRKGQIWFSVTDTGVGMKEDTMKAVFEPFVQGDSSSTKKFGGVGLGLTISKKLTTALGGEIWVESQYGKGSTFSFSVEADLDMNLIERQIEAKKTASQTSENRFKVLIVDDTDDNRFLMRNYLRHADVDMVEATNGLEAFECVSKGGSFDLILMDIQMPVMDGHTAVKKIREWEKSKKISPVYIAAVSAYSEESEIQKSMQAGCDLHLVKPIRKAMFLDFIKSRQHPKKAS